MEPAPGMDLAGRSARPTYDRPGLFAGFGARLVIELVIELTIEP